MAREAREERRASHGCPRLDWFVWMLEVGDDVL